MHFDAGSLKLFVELMTPVDQFSFRYLGLCAEEWKCLGLLQWSTYRF